MNSIKKNFHYLLMFILTLLNFHSFSQELFPKELRWHSCDSITSPVFQDTNQIIEWGKNQLPFSSVSSQEFLVKGVTFKVLMISGCSGLPCWNIYILKKNKDIWQLKMSTNSRSTEKIEINIDNTQEKITFKTKSGQIGELAFESLILNPDEQK